MDIYLKKQAGGFSFHINESYAKAVDELFLNTLAVDGYRYASQKKERKLCKECTLSDGTPVYVKFWKPRLAFQRIRTVWHPTKIEVEGNQYLQFIRNKLPVPDIVLWGSQRIPSSKYGIFKVGMVVTRRIEEGENLTLLFMQKKQPWIIGNNSQRFGVLEKIAQLLHEIHTRKLIHGDYVLRNIIFTSEKPNGKYWIIDLGSGRSLPSHKLLTHAHFNHDLFRMVCDLARKGFSRDEALLFLNAYMCCENKNAQSYELAKKCLEVCLRRKDHRAMEASRFFNDTDFHNSSLSPKSVV